MSKHVSPGDVIAAIKEEQRLTRARHDAEIDTRYAERHGKGDDFIIAEKREAATLMAWHEAWTDAKSAVTAALATLGLDPNMIKPYL